MSAHGHSIAGFDGLENIDAQTLRVALAKDGVVVLRRIFDAVEIDRMRGIVRDYLVRSGRRFSLGRTQPNAVSKVHALEFLYAHPKVLAAFETILGPGNIVFTGHSDIHMNMLSGWHKDSGESVGGYFKGNYFEADDCKVYKIAVYLQDHKEENGLTVRLGSHRTPAMQDGPVVHVGSQAGDILIFDVRLTHIGQFPDPLEKSLMGLNLALNGGDRTQQDNAVISENQSSLLACGPAEGPNVSIFHLRRRQFLHPSIFPGEYGAPKCAGGIDRSSHPYEAGGSIELHGRACIWLSTVKRQLKARHQNCP